MLGQTHIQVFIHVFEWYVLVKIYVEDTRKHFKDYKHPILQPSFDFNRGQKDSFISRG